MREPARPRSPGRLAGSAESGASSSALALFVATIAFVAIRRAWRHVMGIAWLELIALDAGVQAGHATKPTAVIHSLLPEARNRLDADGVHGGVLSWRCRWFRSGRLRLADVGGWPGVCAVLGIAHVSPGSDQTLDARGPSSRGSSHRYSAERRC